MREEVTNSENAFTLNVFWIYIPGWTCVLEHVGAPVEVTPTLNANTPYSNPSLSRVLHTWLLLSAKLHPLPQSGSMHASFFF